MTISLPAPLDVKLMNMTASVLLVGCALGALAAGAWWVLRYPGFAIARIVVEGDLVHNNAVTLRANVGPHLTGNFFSVDLRAARNAFEQVPWVRSAHVQRVYPGSLHVQLQEHDAVAYWGPETGSALVNSHGEVFEANVGDVEQEGLPRLLGPEGKSAEVLQMHGVLQPVFATLGLEIEELALSGRGGWRARLDSDAAVELGGGEPQEVVQRAQRFARTLTQVAGQYGRRADALESADLRHAGGYALRLRGVSTVLPDAAAAAGGAAGGVRRR
jgi:cell division protein FtsQ